MEDNKNKLFDFGYANSDGYRSIMLFKSENRLSVAKYILKTLKDYKENKTVSSEKFFEPFKYYGIKIGCCKEESIHFGNNKDLLDYLIKLSPNEFLDIIDNTHTHSGGDSFSYTIEKLEFLDITSN